MWVPTLSVLQTLSEVGASVWAKSSYFQRQYKRFIHRATKGKLMVPVFGAGGVGKSTTARFLSGMLNPLAPPQKYAESISTEKDYHFPGNIVAQFVVPPGQEMRVSAHWPDLQRKVAAGKSKGIINLVSYGYHSFMIEDFKLHKFYKAGMTAASFMDEYTKERRGLELKLLDEIIAAAKFTPKPLWMLTVVTKQDLWWDRHDTVKDYYENGPYSERLAEIEKQVGKSRFQHEFVPSSLVVSNFCSGDGTVLVPTCQGYDQSLHVAALTALLQSFEKLGG